MWSEELLNDTSAVLHQALLPLIFEQQSHTNFLFQSTSSLVQQSSKFGIVKNVCPKQRILYIRTSFYEQTIWSKITVQNLNFILNFHSILLKSVFSNYS